MEMSLDKRISELLDECFADLSSPGTPLSVAVGKAKRIARLRGDAENLLWLEMEMRSGWNEMSAADLAPALAGRYSEEEAMRQASQLSTFYTEERTDHFPNAEKDGTEERSLLVSVRELEDRLSLADEATDKMAPQGRMQALAAVGQSIAAIRRMLGRIEHRVHDFLSVTEHQLLFGQLNADIFEGNRRYVDAQLASVSPRALEQLVSAYRRAQDGDDEARSQAMLSCRRALKSVADVLCPATDSGGQGGSSNGPALTDDKWRNRLTEFVKRSAGSHANGGMLQSQLAELARRFRGLSEASSRGVHADATEFELNQVVIQTYITIGDLLRLHETGSSGAISQGLAATAGR